MAERPYNDPSIYAAASGIAKLFAPPSAQDMHAWAAGNALRQKQAMQEAIWGAASAPGARLQDIDVRAVAAGLYNPNQSVYSVDQGNATALKQTGMNNQTDILKTRIQQAAESERAMNAPVITQANSVAHLPQALRGRFGGAPALTGGVKLDQGEVMTLPPEAGGEVFRGPEKPLTAEELRAKVVGGMPQSQQNAWAMGATPVENIVTPEGPRTVYRTDAVGKEPVLGADKRSELAQLQKERADIMAQNPNDPRVAEYNQRIQALGRGQQQGQYDKTSDELLAKENAEISAGASGAIGDMRMLTLLDKAVNDPQAMQGGLADFNLAVRKIAGAFGVPTGDTSPAEMINALGNQLALRLRDPSNGAGMPGSLSDSDRLFLKSMSISLGNSPEANRQLVQYYFKLQQKNLAREELRQQYVGKNGRLDENWRAQDIALQKQFMLPEQATGGGGGSVAGEAINAAKPAPGGARVIRQVR
jgi:hypothetical protein